MKRRQRSGDQRNWTARVAGLALVAVAGGAFVLAMSADVSDGPETRNVTGPGDGNVSASSTMNQGGGTMQASAQAPPEPASPPRFFGVTTPSGPYNLAELEGFQRAAGKKPAVLMFSQDWVQGPVRRQLLDSVADRDMLPMVTWEPRDHSKAAGPEQAEFALNRILDGSWDAYIREWAEGVREWGRPVAVRFGQQMNGNWFPWAEGVNGNQPGQYAAAWRHVRGIVKDAGASNTVWVWSPNISYTGSTPLAGLYPGDEHVDWVGIDGYNGGSALPWGGWVSPEQLFGPTISEIRSFTAKPLVLTEVGATEVGGNKASWIGELFKYLSTRGDVLGFVWVEAAREADWRITSSVGATGAFAAGVTDPRFGAVSLPAGARTG